MKSLNRALDIVELIAEHRGIGVREIARISGLPPATAHRIVAALVKRGYIGKDEGTHTYTLSPKFLILGERVQQQIDIVGVARPFLEKLMAETRENANLCIRDDYRIIYIDHVGSPDHNLTIFTKLGGSAPLYASGVGKIFLSLMSAPDFQQYIDDVELRPYTEHTLADPDALVEEMATIRSNGYAIDNQEKELGVRCVAAPVLNHLNRVQAAISVSGAAQRISTKRLPALGKVVVQYARLISAALGHRNP